MNKKNIITLVIVALSVQALAYLATQYVFKSQQQREIESDFSMLESYLKQKQYIN